MRVPVDFAERHEHVRTQPVVFFPSSVSQTTPYSKILNPELDKERFAFQLRPQAPCLLRTLKHPKEHGLVTSRVEREILPKRHPSIEQERKLFDTGVRVHIQISQRLGILLPIIPIHVYADDKLHREFVPGALIQAMLFSKDSVRDVRQEQSELDQRLHRPEDDRGVQGGVGDCAAAFG